MTGDAGDTATADNTATDNLANPDSPVLPDAANHANENAMPDVAEDGMAEDTVRINRSVKTGDDASDAMFAVMIIC